MIKNIGLSTGKAAKYCLVTPDTIVNWIKKNRIIARKTMGGQYRILVQDLRNFMIRNGLKTDLLDSEFKLRRYCWEHQNNNGSSPMFGTSCEDCLARRVLALNCYELRSALSTHMDDLDVCIKCHYLCDWQLQNNENQTETIHQLSSSEGATL